MDKNNRFHPLDILVADDSIFILETLVPFVDFPFKRLLIFYIKYRELTSILNSLNNRDFLKSCGFDCHPKSTEEMVENMCDFMPEQVSGNIKQMRQMFNMLQMMNQSSGGNPFSQMFSAGDTGHDTHAGTDNMFSENMQGMAGMSPDNMANLFNMINQMNQTAGTDHIYSENQTTETNNINNNRQETDYNQTNSGDDLFSSVMSILEEEQSDYLS